MHTGMIRTRQRLWSKFSLTSGRLYHRHPLVLVHRLQASRPQFELPLKRNNSISFRGSKRLVNLSSGGGIEPGNGIATVLAHQPELTIPEDIVVRLAPLPKFTAPTWEPTCVFLMTPTFSNWLSDDDAFLRPALARLFGSSDATVCCSGVSKSLDVLVAVVDRLDLINQITETSAQGSTKSWNGYEGVAYFLTDRQNLQFELDGGQQNSVGKHLQFAFHSDPSHVTKAEIRRKGWRFSPSSIRAKLPLANTVFQTGQLATLRQSKWRLSDGALGWHREATGELSSASLIWPSIAPLKMRNLARHLSIQLVPLTVPRKVEDSMGNIVRNFTNESTTVPASRELEASISEYFEARNMSPHALSVWALVSPAYALDPDSSESVQQDTRHNWSRKPPYHAHKIRSALSKGARLHRVLSGGGGWGKKAGLISLDPLDHTSQKAESEDESLSETLAAEEALAQVARPGDFIQFFTTPAEQKSSSAKIRVTRRDRKDSMQQLSIGVIPSTIDDRLLGQTTSSDGPAQFTICRSGCKVLTESALDLQLEYGSSLRRIHRSKLDVPYAFITHRAYLDDNSSKPITRLYRTHQSAFAGTASGVVSPIQRRHYSHYPTPIRSCGSNSGVEIRMYPNGRGARNSRLPSPLYFRQSRSIQGPSTASPAEPDLASHSQNYFADRHRIATLQNEDSANFVGNSQWPGKDHQSNLVRTISGLAFRKTQSSKALHQTTASENEDYMNGVKTNPRPGKNTQSIPVRKVTHLIIRRLQLPNPLHQMIYQTVVPRKQRSRNFTPRKGSLIRKLWVQRRVFWTFFGNERYKERARGGRAAWKRRETAHTFHAVWNRREAARIMKAFPVRRIETTDEVDAENAWKFFESRERRRERELQEELQPSYAARISHWSKNRREGPVADAGLENVDLDEFVEENRERSDTSGAAHSLIW